VHETATEITGNLQYRKLIELMYEATGDA